MLSFMLINQIILLNTLPFTIFLNNIRNFIHCDDEVMAIHKFQVLLINLL